VNESLWLFTNCSIIDSITASVDIKPFPKGLTVIFSRCGLMSRLRPAGVALADSELMEYPVALCHSLPEAPHLDIEHRAYRDDAPWDGVSAIHSGMKGSRNMMESREGNSYFACGDLLKRHEVGKPCFGGAREGVAMFLL
jgi:hypothetical protein